MSQRTAFDGQLYIADSSAWHRANDDTIASEWSTALENSQILTCGPVRLELLYSTRNYTELVALREALDALREVPIGPAIFHRSEQALEELSEVLDGYHRVSPADVLIAAAAESVGVGVLHCDKHYDKLAEVLTFESRWLEHSREPKQ